jgi:iron complex outermembrane receptor protein
MRPGRWRVWPRKRAVHVGVAPILLCFTLPLSGQAQTVEPRYEPHASGAATVIYPDATALGAQNVVDLLQWNVPGLVLVRKGDTVEIYLRGLQQSLVNPPGNPLLIIDGIKISDDFFSRELQSLNPFRVERIEVLRDMASTVMYGTRASAGVILIFTRRR